MGFAFCQDQRECKQRARRATIVAEKLRHYTTFENNIQAVLDELHEMRLPVMAEQLWRMTENELISGKNNAANRCRKNARLSQTLAAIGKIDYKPERKINDSANS